MNYSDHSHPAQDLGGVPSMAEHRLVMENLEALTRDFERLQRQFQAEREVSAAITDGSVTVERIAAAIERRARELIPEDDMAALIAGLSRDPDALLGLQLLKLAEEIRRDQS